MNIIHISDIHFGNPNGVYLKSALHRAIEDFIDEMGRDLFLIISGDITYKGSKEGFEEAQAFFKEVITKNKLDKSRILACPGNHDIQRDDSPRFSLFSDFIYALRRDHKCNFINNNFISYMYDDVFFLLINSSYHLDYGYGLVDEEIFNFIEKEKKEIDKCKYKIAITHHHLINQFRDDTSAIRNSYPILYALDVAGFNLILHGHQHAVQNMPIGKSHMAIAAARSFNFQEKGYPNGISHYSLKDGELEKNIYEFVNDAAPTKLKLVKL